MLLGVSLKLLPADWDASKQVCHRHGCPALCEPKKESGWDKSNQYSESDDA